MQQAIARMVGEIVNILSHHRLTIYLYGSVTMDDFQPGWSDIDVLGLTEEPLTLTEAQALVALRPTLAAAHPENPYYGLFEGGFCSWGGLLHRSPDMAAYWGTSGTRVREDYEIGPFSTLELLEHGQCLYGEDHRNRFQRPSRVELVAGVRWYYGFIRKYAQETKPAVTSAGWLFDSARCLYTLETGGVIAKTKAGEWALAQGLVPDVETMQRALLLRRNTALATQGDNPAWLASLGPKIQAFADVLEARLAEV